MIAFGSFHANIQWLIYLMRKTVLVSLVFFIYDIQNTGVDVIKMGSSSS